MNADSVKARLKNFAVSSGCTFQEALVYYGLERTIYRISVSQYASHFVLKGGIFLYAVFDRKYSRATTDVDLLARCISNSAEEMKAVIAQKSRIRKFKQAYLHAEPFRGGAFRSAGNDLLRTTDQFLDEIRTYRESPV